MTDPIQSLLDRVGATMRDFSNQSRVGSLFRRGGVADTPELQRILALPEYDWESDPDIPQLQAYFDQIYGLPFRPQCRRLCGHETRQKYCDECYRAARACACGGEGIMHLRPLQAAALAAIHDYGGLVGTIRVGGGKTLVTYLAGVVSESERTLLLVPAKLKEKTKRDFAMLGRHWRKPKRLHIMTTELLSRDRGVAELEAFAPDLIIADEAQRFKSKSAACTRRLNRYLTKKNPDCRYVDLSGTTMKRSLREIHHRQSWALEDGMQPLPRDWHNLSDWADALDEKVRTGARLMPGALTRLFTDVEENAIRSDASKENQIKMARQAFRRRFTRTPGVIATTDQFDGAMPLLITGVSWDVGPAVREAFRLLRDTWELPDGHTIESPAQLWSAARCLIQGFYYRYDPAPPEEWLLARKVWGSMVREILSRFRDIDSPMIAAREVERGRIPWAVDAWREWCRIRPIYKPQTKAFWVDDSAIEFCAKWAAKNRGIIWVNEIAMGERLMKDCGLPYYGAGGVCGKKPIEQETETCVASIAANAEGRNLQHYAASLTIAPPPGGNVWEQKLGRMHRDGQEADEVTDEVAIGCYENWRVVTQAFRDAEFAERAGGQKQKLNFADVTIPTPEEVRALGKNGDPLWAKTNADYFDADRDWTDNEIRYSAMGFHERAKARSENPFG